MFPKEQLNRICRHSPFMESHGASRDDRFLGLSLMYYTIVYSMKASLAVCVGSGGGFVPRLMKEAQRDLGRGRTVLVDGNCGDWGRPDWLAETSPFRQEYPDIELMIELSIEASKKFNDSTIDFIHIDADHSYEMILQDLNSWFPKVKTGGIITMHDSKPKAVQRRTGIAVGTNMAYEEFAKTHKVESVNFFGPHCGKGTRLVVKR